MAMKTQTCEKCGSIIKSNNVYGVCIRCQTCAPPIVQRRCLKCNEMFTSAGWHNRICPECQQKNNRMSHAFAVRLAYS